MGGSWASHGRVMGGSWAGLGVTGGRTVTVAGSVQNPPGSLSHAMTPNFASIPNPNQITSPQACWRIFFLDSIINRAASSPPFGSISKRLSSLGKPLVLPHGACTNQFRRAWLTQGYTDVSNLGWPATSVGMGGAAHGTEVEGLRVRKGGNQAYAKSTRRRRRSGGQR